MLFKAPHLEMINLCMGAIEERVTFASCYIYGKIVKMGPSQIITFADMDVFKKG